MEPDIVQDSLSKLTEEEIGKQLIKLRETDQIKELQTVLRDKYVVIIIIHNRRCMVLYQYWYR